MSLSPVSVSIEDITDGNSWLKIKSVKDGAVKINRKAIEKEKERSLRTSILLSVNCKDIIKTKRN
tara:strand:+ start:1221 stop:1415 length:195 start_codon:yes stop_codon:yes gene_type:complete